MKNFDPLLIVRALCCIVIVWRHSYPGLSIWIGRHDITSIFIPNTSVAVFLFYFLSAYGVGYGFASGKYNFSLQSLLNFYKNRILRIVPLYYFLLALTPFIFYNQYPLNSNDLIRLATFTATSTIELSSYRIWGMLSTEMQFYWIAPILIFFTSKTIAKLPIIISILLSLLVGACVRLLLLTQNLHNDGIYISTVFTTILGNLDIFLMGILSSTYLVKNEFILSQKNKIILATILAIGFVPWFIWTGNLQYVIGQENWFIPWRNQMMFLLPPTTSLFGAALTLLMARKIISPPYVQNPLNLVKDFLNPTRLLYVLGVLSYGIYLWHAPIADAVYNTIGTPFGIAPTLYRFTIVLLFSILCSLGTYLFIEVPFHKLASHRRKSQK